MLIKFITALAWICGPVCVLAFIGAIREEDMPVARFSALLAIPAFAWLLAIYVL